MPVQLDMVWANGEHMHACAAPKVIPSAELPPLKWTPADVEGVVAFLVGEKNFSEDRVRKAVEKLNASRGKANQGVLSSGCCADVIKVSEAKCSCNG